MMFICLCGVYLFQQRHIISPPEKNLPMSFAKKKNKGKRKRKKEIYKTQSVNNNHSKPCHIWDNQ